MGGLGAWHQIYKITCFKGIHVLLSFLLSFFWVSCSSVNTRERERERERDVMRACWCLQVAVKLDYDHDGRLELKRKKGIRNDDPSPRDKKVRADWFAGRGRRKWVPMLSPVFAASVLTLPHRPAARLPMLQSCARATPFFLLGTAHPLSLL